MKTFFNMVIIGLLVVTVASCGSKAEKVSLKEGTPAYVLAKDLSAIIPALAPDKNSMLVKTKGFEVNTAEVIQVLVNNFGNRAQQLKQADAAQLKDIFERAAEQIAERKLLLAEAKKSKIAVSQEEVNKVLQQQFNQLGGEQAFLEALKSEGISYDYVKANIEESLIMEKFLEKAAAGSDTISEDEIKAVYDQDKTATVRHILLLTSGKTDEQKAALHKQMEDILARAKAGEDFSELARKYSEDPGSKDKGGLYEDFSRGEMVKPFEEAAFSVPIGKISDIVETAYGYHIIKVENRKKDARPFEEAKAEIEAKLKDEKKQAGFDNLIEGLKEKSGFKKIAL